MAGRRRLLFAGVATLLIAGGIALFLVLRCHPGEAVGRLPGIALVVLVDTSESMSGSVADVGGRKAPKIDIARRTVSGLVRRLEEFSKANPDRNLQVAVYEFSARGHGALCRPVVRMGKPDLAAAREAVGRMSPDGGTPIGDAMEVAKEALDRAALASDHMLVVTDGQNTHGRDPGQVAKALAQLPLEQRPALYFVAFDVAAAQFAAVQEAGGLVLSASNETQLMETLDFILGEKILVEKPSRPK